MMTKRNKVLGSLLGGALAAMALTSTPAIAQRVAGYTEARAAGQIGEMMDGYVGIVGSPSAELERIVSEINTLRKQVYIQRAQAQAQPTTLEQYAISTGCTLIMDLEPGMKYLAPRSKNSQSCPKHV